MLFAGVAGDDVGEIVAGQVDGRGSGGVGRTQRLDRDAGCEHIAHRGVHGVGAGGVGDLVRRIVNEERIVAAAAVHGVGAAAAVEQVGAVVAGEDIGELVAGEIDRRRARGGRRPQRFDRHARFEDVSHRGVHSYRCPGRHARQ